MLLRTIARVILIAVFAPLILYVNPTTAQEAPPQWSSDGDTLNTPVRLSAPATTPPADAPAAAHAPAAPSAITEYTLPVAPLNVIASQNDPIWFSAFTADAIGRLDVAAGQVSLFSRPGTGSVWGIQTDIQGNIWFTTVNTSTVGKLNPTTHTFTEWAVPATHFALVRNSNTGEVWFSSRDTAPGIYRLSPATNAVTDWSIGPYTLFFDVVMDSNGNIWFTVQPSGTQVVGRLNPTTNQVVVWITPDPVSRPFRLWAEAADSIWLTERDANIVAHLTPSTNTLHEFRVPTAGSLPNSLLLHNGFTWFTENSGNKLGRLNPITAPQTTTVLIPSSFIATQTMSTVNPSSYSVAPTVSPVISTTTIISPAATTGFLEYPVPTASSGLFGIDLAGNNLWFAESGANRLGKLVIDNSTAVSFTNYIHLPIVARP